MTWDYIPPDEARMMHGVWAIEEAREARKIRIPYDRWFHETTTVNDCFTNTAQLLYESCGVPAEVVTAAKRGGFTYTTNQAPTMRVTYTTSTAHT